MMLGNNIGDEAGITICIHRHCAGNIVFYSSATALLFTIFIMRRGTQFLVLFFPCMNWCFHIRLTRDVGRPEYSHVLFSWNDQYLFQQPDYSLTPLMLTEGLVSDGNHAGVRLVVNIMAIIFYILLVTFSTFCQRCVWLRDWFVLTPL